MLGRTQQNCMTCGKEISPCTRGDCAECYAKRKTRSKTANEQAIKFYCPCTRDWGLKELSFDDATENGAPKCDSCLRKMRVDKFHVGLKEVLLLAAEKEKSKEKTA